MPLPAQEKAESGTVSVALPIRTSAPPGFQSRMIPRTGSPSSKNRFHPGRFVVSGLVTNWIPCLRKPRRRSTARRPERTASLAAVCQTESMVVVTSSPPSSTRSLPYFS